MSRKRTKNGRKDKRALGRLRRIINPLSPRGAPNRDRSKLAGAGLRSGRILRRDGRRIPKKMWRAVNFGITRIPNTEISPELVEKNLGSRAEILAIRRIARISTAAQLPADLDVQPLPDPAAAILRIHRGSAGARSYRPISMSNPFPTGVTPSVGTRAGTRARPIGGHCTLPVPGWIS